MEHPKRSLSLQILKQARGQIVVWPDSFLSGEETELRLALIRVSGLSLMRAIAYPKS